MSAYPQAFQQEVEQPDKWELRTADGVFIKQMYLAKRGNIVPQHVHEYHHHTMLAHGAVRVWIEKKNGRDYHAPCGIFIEAGRQHTFMALEPETVLYCIHKLHDDDVKLLGEGSL